MDQNNKFFQPEQTNQVPVQQSPVQPMMQQTYTQPTTPQKQGNGWAIAGLLCSLFCCQPLGFIFSIIGLVKSKKTNSGKAMSIIGIIIPIIAIIISVVAAIFFMSLWPSIKESLEGSTTCANGANYRYGTYEDAYYVNCGDYEDDGTYTCRFNTVNEYNEVVRRQVVCGLDEVVVTKADDNVFAGNEYIELDDESYFKFGFDDTFRYYQSEDELDDYYFEGTYEVYRGEAAIDYIATELSKYGLTREEQENFMNNDTLNVENYYLLILNNEKLIMDGKNQLTKTQVTPYYGFSNDDQTEIVLVNMNTATTYELELQN